MSDNYLRRGTSVILVGIIGGFTADYVLNISLSRLLPAADYGDYKVACAFAFLSSVLVLLGGDRAALKYLSGPLSRSDPSGVWEFLRFYLLIALSLSALVVLITILASLMHVGIEDLQGHHPLVPMAFLIPAIALGALLSRVLQASRHLADANWPWRIGLPVLKLVLVLALSWLVGAITLMQVIACASVAVFAVLVWQWLRLRRLRLIVLKRQPGSINPRSLLKDSVPMMLAVLVGVAMSQADLFMLEILGSEVEVGHYAAAAVTAHVVLLVQVTFTSLFTPLISPAMEQGKKQERDLFRMAQRRITLVVIPVFALLIVFSKPLMAVFDPGFAAAVSSMRILSLAYVCWALAAFSSIWLQFSGRGHKVVLISITMLTLNLVSNYFLIPRYGLNGAASATLIAMVIGSVLLILAGRVRSEAV